jgi:multicomponent Na+:H+ antiporter subunit D
MAVAQSFDLAAQLPVLQVVVPLMAAPLCIVLRHRLVAWGWATLVSLVTFAMALALLDRTLGGGVLSYAVGGWAAPWGIELRIDLLSALMMVLVSGVGAITLLWGRVSIFAEIPADRTYLFFVCYLLCLTGLMGMVVTGDAFNLFVFLEISSLSSYAMIALGPSRRALMAAFTYLVMGTIGATFYVIGVGLLYMVTGTLNMADLAATLSTTPHHRTVIVAVAFLVVGLGLKLALFPLHKWLPRAYGNAPSAVTVFLAATATKVSLYVLIRVFFTVLGDVPLLADRRWAEMLIPFALAGMFSASAVAIFQNNVRKLLAYSSVAQIGYMALGVGLASVSGLTAGIVHILNHALIKGALFMAAGAVALRVGSARLEDWQGVAARMPLTMAGFTVAGVSLIGVPLTAGFVSKWWLMTAAFEKGWWPLAMLIVLASLLAVIYVWRVIEAAYLMPPTRDLSAVREAPWSMQAALWVLVAANIWFGIDTTYSVGLARTAAEHLVGPSTMIATAKGPGS